MDVRLGRFLTRTTAWPPGARAAALAVLMAQVALSCSTAHPCFGPPGSWKPFITVQLFGERWDPRLVFDERGRSSLFWEGSMFHSTDRCGELTVGVKDDLFSAWEAVPQEAVSSLRDEIAVFYSPSRLYVLGSAEELEDRPLLREAVITTLRIALDKYPGKRLRRFLEEHPLGVLLGY